MNTKLWIIDLYLINAIVHEWILHEYANEINVKSQMKMYMKQGKFWGMTVTYIECLCNAIYRLLHMYTNQWTHGLFWMYMRL